MIGTLYLLDTLQGAFVVAVIALLIIVGWCLWNGVDLETVKFRYSGEHYIVKVSLYDDDTLVQPSWARVTCACGKIIELRGEDFATSETLELYALKAFEQHQTKEGTRAK